MIRFHHVNLGVPPEGLAAQGAFLVDVLGYVKIQPTPEALAFGANWYEAEDGTQVHLSEDPDHRPAARAHVAIELGDGLDDVHDRLVGLGYDVKPPSEGPVRVLICLDPSGNRWELRG